MNIQIISDLHLEHDNNFQFEKVEDADVLVLAGDIGSFTHHYDFIRSCSEKIKTIMILGNHEPIGHSIKETAIAWKNIKIPNFYFLDNETVEIDGVHFIGSTLWTNLNADPINQIAIQQTISDFKGIFKEDKSGLVNIQDLQKEFEKSLFFIEQELSKNYAKKVLITHHLPTLASISDEYISSPYNAAFASNLSNLLLYSNNLDVCIHGHTHKYFDYILGDNVRVVCNPRGYSGENKLFNPFKMINI